MGTLGILGFTGCSALSESDGIRVGGVRVQSGFEADHSVTVVLVRDGETVLDQRFTVGGSAESQTVTATWSTEPASYEVIYAVAGPEIELDVATRQFQSEDVPEDSECVGVNIVLVDMGDVKHFVTLRAASELAAIDCE